MGKIVLVLGGTKTGKTRFAHEKAVKAQDEGKRIGYLATAQGRDDEMVDRIRRHQQDRPSEWLTLEEPLEAEAALVSAEGSCDVILLDCLTLLMTNWLMDLQDFEAGESGDGDIPDRKIAEEAFHNHVGRILDWAASWPGELVIISNLVENGLVSIYPFTRLFQDLAGMTHQRIAAQADMVVQMVAGLPLYLKGAEG